MSDYNAVLKDGQEIYIPGWPVDVALENLTRAGQFLGTDHIVRMSELNQAACILAIMESKDPNQSASLIKHFVCQVRISGKKIEPNGLDAMFSGNLGQIAEIFCHVIHSQYADFFASGLAKEVSPES